MPKNFPNKRTMSEGDCGPVALLVLGHVHSTTCRTHIFLSPHQCTLLRTCFVLCVAHVTTITVAEGRVKAQDVFVTIAVCFITKKNPHCFMSLLHPLGYTGPAHLPLTLRTPSAPLSSLSTPWPTRAPNPAQETPQGEQMSGSLANPTLLTGHVHSMGTHIKTSIEHPSRSGNKLTDQQVARTPAA